MPLTELQHRRTHNLLLIKKLFDCRENASPFTLVLDSLEQGARPVQEQLIVGANKTKARVIFVSLETAKAPRGVDIFLPVQHSDFQSLREKISKHAAEPSHRHLIVIDSVNSLLGLPKAADELSTFLSSLITPNTSILATYHLDVPVSVDVATYGPAPLALLKYLATTVLTLHTLSHLVAERQARSRSLVAPAFGLLEEKEGIIAGLGSNDPRGAVIEMEYRRRSGRPVHEVFVLPSQSARARTRAQQPGTIMLLDDHSEYRAAGGETADALAGIPADQGGSETTFELGLTAKQRRDREGVVLPYFDAQNQGGVGEGGRILYDMGVEDDFDEEEDEI